MKREQRVSDELKSINKVLDIFSLEDVSAAIFLDVRTQKKNGDYPVKIRVTHKRDQNYYPAKDISLDEWKSLLSINNPRGKLLEKKKEIYISFNNIIDIIKELAPGRKFTLKALARSFSQGAKDSVLDAFKVKIKALQEAGRISTAVWYGCTLKSIEKYMEDKGLTFNSITPEWLEAYEKHLKSSKYKQHGSKVEKTRSDSTVSMYQRSLRAILNDALKKNIITQSQYPYGGDKYIVPVGEGRKIALTASQLTEVLNCPIPTEDEKWRDLFAFSYFCNGANLTDILKLKQENIKRTTKGDIIQWNRQKTTKRGIKSHRLQALITPEMQMILNKYPDHDYLFPYLSNGMKADIQYKVIQQTIHNVNREMKKIGKKLGIEKLTSYVARHSFASIARRSDVDVYNISKKLGHTSIKTTEVYLDSLNIDDLIEDAAKMPSLQKSESKERRSI